MELSEETTQYLPRILEIVRRALEGTSCSIWLFGSRATGGATTASDFDLAVSSEGDVSRALSRAREELEESTIPFFVDLVELGNASDALKSLVQRKEVLLWKS